MSLLIVLFMLFSFSSCSLDKMASNITAKIFEGGAPAMEQGEDIQTNEIAAMSMLKMTEVFHHHNPDNEIYLLLLSKSYGNYAYGFFENHMLRTKGKDEKEYGSYLRRAKIFYAKGKEYGLRLLNKNGGFREALSSNMDDFEKAVKDFDKDDAAPLYWTAFNWGNYINHNKDDPIAIAGLGRVEVMMRRVLELDENFFYASPHLFYGVYYASRPPMLGGSPAKAKEHFNTAIRLTEHKFLMANVNYAQFYAVQVQDKDLFIKQLQTVLSQSPDMLPEQRLANLLAQERARILLTKTDQYF